MKIKEFISKYKIVIFLVAMIFILAFIKSYFGKQAENNSFDITKNISNNSETSENINNTENLTEEITPEAEEVVDEKEVEELTKVYDSLETEEEQNVFLDSLSDEQLDEFLAEEPTEEYELENELPYEADTFVVKQYTGAYVLLVKAKGNNFEKSNADLENWLIETTTNPEEIVLIWED